MINERIEALRLEMRARNMDAYIIPSSDPHQSEYVPERWKSRQWISGFTGSAGIVLITLDGAYLWTDGRYHIQAAGELAGSEFQLVKWGLEGVPEIHDWLAANMEAGSVLGFDGAVVSVEMHRKIQAAAGAKSFVYSTEHDLIEYIWSDRPLMPVDKIFVHEMPFAGNTVQEKLQRLRRDMEENQVTYQLVSTLDDAAWLFNIRGWDISYSPVALCYGVVSQDGAWLFISRDKLDDRAIEHFSENQIEIQDYADISGFLSELESGEQVRFDPATLSVSLYSALAEDVERSESVNAVAMLKAVKSEAEIENMKRSQIRDGVAMVRFMKWLEEAVPRGEATELSAEAMLRTFRSEQEHFVAESFHTIAAYMAHGAMMHYSATETSSATLAPEGFFLFDSGGNYLDGTTDITRTAALGHLTDQMKRDYTLTLKSHISLAKLRFLSGSTGSKVDMIARQPLWAEGIDYKCGTGHGVGYFLNVHEGPQTMKMAPNSVVLRPGMVLTNEPGVYREGQYGIRIENTMVVRKDIETEFGQFLAFETISLCPIDMKPVVKAMLSDAEIEWINNYHGQVRKTLSSRLTPDENEWLEKATRPL